MKTNKPPKTPLFNSRPRKTIFTVHCREDIDFKNPKSNQRTFGWFSKKSDALKCVKINNCDIYECSHTYAVVEEIQEGVFGPAIREWWFKWDKKHERYLNIDKPKELYNVVNFGLG